MPFCLEETVWFDDILLNYCNVLYDIYDIYDVKKLKEQHTLKLSGSNIQLIFFVSFLPSFSLVVIHGGVFSQVKTEKGIKQEKLDGVAP